MSVPSNWNKQLAVVLLAPGGTAAQDLKATAVLLNGNNAAFELANFDAANSGSGSGTIASWNNTAVNWTVTWTRDGAIVSIFINGQLTATLDGAVQNSNGGGAILNDGANTGGAWDRS